MNIAASNRVDVGFVLARRRHALCLFPQLLGDEGFYVSKPDVRGMFKSIVSNGETQFVATEIPSIM